MNEAPILRISLDIETLSTKPNALPISIGATAFWREASPITVGDWEVTKTPFLASITGADSLAAFGGTRASYDIDPLTVAWWQEQSIEARAALGINPMPLDSMLHAFCGWVLATVERHGRIYHNGETAEVDVEFWAKPPTFDCVILEHAFHDYRIECPWHYRATRCLNTLQALAPLAADPPDFPNFVLHRADHDAEQQAHSIMACLDSLLEDGAVER